MAMSFVVRASFPNELPALAKFAERCQADPQRHCAHLSEDAATIVVDVEEATRITGRFLFDNPPDPKDMRAAGTGTFDYENEERIVERWRRAQAMMAGDP